MIKVYSLQNEQGLVIANLASGTAVEILATDGNYAQIKTVDGKTGWINTKFVKKEKPAAQAYSELLAKYNTANQELERAKVDLHKLNEVERVARNAGAARDELNESKKQIEKLKRDLNARDKQLAVAQKNITDLKQELAGNQPNSNTPDTDTTGDNTDSSPSGVSEAPPLESSLDVYMVPFLWAAIAMIFTMIIGFILGMRWLDRRIRKRHGGVRFY